MNKYKVGDKFEIKVTGETSIARDYYYVTTVGIVNEEALDRLKRIEPAEPEESVEPEVDWSKVEVDTPILVKDHSDDDWIRRYFAKYEKGEIYAWDRGATSWSVNCNVGVVWKYAKLAEVEE